MLSRNNNLSTRQMLARLREGARPFPTMVSDTPNILTCHMPHRHQRHPDRAVPVHHRHLRRRYGRCRPTRCSLPRARLRPFHGPHRSLPARTSISTPPPAPRPVAGVFPRFAWTVVSPTINPPAVVGANTATASVIAPTSGSITLRVTVTDDQGRVDAVEVVVEPNRTTSQRRPPPGSAACATPVTSGPTPGSGPRTPPPPTSSSSGSRRRPSRRWRRRIARASSRSSC